MKTTITPEPALLGFLRDGPLHGYDLHRQITVQLGPAWHLGMSQMYAILKDFETRGWVRTLIQQQPNRPARKVLTLTPAGKRAFDSWMSQSAHGLREFRVDFFARLYFARRQGKRALDRFLRHQLGATRSEIESLRRIPAASEYAALVRGFRIAQLTAIAKWLESYRAAPDLAPSVGRSAARKRHA